jgi:prephenate dehydrogenase
MQMIDQLVLDNNVALHPMMGNSYQLNNIASEIIILMKEHKSKDEIVENICSKYDVKKEEMFIDLSDFMAKLRVYGLVQ